MNTTHLNRLWAAQSNPLKLMAHLEDVEDSLNAAYLGLWNKVVQWDLFDTVAEVSI